MGIHDRALSFPRLLIIFITVPTERLAMRWVQKYISAFGGDPSKVMM
jgi:hypothetical protein